MIREAFYAVPYSKSDLRNDLRSPQIMSVQAAAAAELAGDCTADPRAAVTAARRERHPETTSGLGRVARIPMISCDIWS